MRVIRLVKGYKLNVTDSEFAALQLMLKLGQEEALKEANYAFLPNSAKAAIRKPPFIDRERGPLVITDDRRTAADAVGGDDS